MASITNDLIITFNWDGKGNTGVFNGKQVPAGKYSVIIKEGYFLYLSGNYTTASNVFSGEIEIIDSEPTANDITKEDVRTSDSILSDVVGNLVSYPRQNFGIIAIGGDIDKSDDLIKEYGGEKKNWYKLKATGLVNKRIPVQAGNPSINPECAEVHWYEYRRKDHGKFTTMVKVKFDLETGKFLWMGNNKCK